MLPPDSEVASVSVRSSSGIRPGACSLIEPCMTLTEYYGALVGLTLVDASSWSVSALMVNPSSEVVVPPYFSCVGYLVPVPAVLVARAESVSSKEEGGALPDHLDDFVMGSRPPWGTPDGCRLEASYIDMLMFFRLPGNP